MALKYGAPGKLTPYDIVALIRGHGLNCHYCYRKLSIKEFSVDHKNPFRLGGPNTLSNLVISCRSCNCRKASIPYEVFVVKYRRNADGGLEKLCSGCGKYKRLSKDVMAVSANTYDGFNAYCRVCFTAISRERERLISEEKRMRKSVSA